MDIHKDPPLDIMKTIISHVVNGGSILELCELWNTGYDKMWVWLQEDRGRAAAYDKAVCAQNEWAISRILKELKVLAFSVHAGLYDADGRLKNPTEWDDNTARAVKGFEVIEYFEGVGKDKEQVGWTKKVDMYDKQRAIELYGKYLKMFGERVTVEGMSLEDLVDASNDSRIMGRVPAVN